MPLPDIKNLTREELKHALERMNEKPFHAAAVFKNVYRRGTADFSYFQDVPQKTLAKMASAFTISALAPAETKVSKADGTIKLLFRFHDGAMAESVVMFAKGRASACLSSQSGCECGCAFCATAKIGFKRSLTPHEIIAQFEACRKAAGQEIASIVFMGMGEPFFNWENVKKSVLILSDDMGYGLSQNKITVSTVGIIPGINDLSNSGLKINLAISVITADESQRAKLTPMQARYPLTDVIEAARLDCEKRKKRVLLEYILFDGFNDDEPAADKLAALARRLPCTINLIIHNKTDGTPISARQTATANQFHKLLMARGLRVYLRAERGSDISAACGQLAAKQKNR